MHKCAGLAILSRHAVGRNPLAGSDRRLVAAGIIPRAVMPTDPKFSWGGGRDVRATRDWRTPLFPTDGVGLVPGPAGRNSPRRPLRKSRNHRIVGIREFAYPKCPIRAIDVVSQRNLSLNGNRAVGSKLPVRFRLITYNIHKGIGGVDRRYRPKRIIETLARYRPDIVLLQEVDDRVPRSHRDCQVDLLGDALGFRHRVFQRNVKLREGAYGNAILSRFPLSDVRHVDLTVPLKKRRRALVAHCRLHVNEHTRRLLICTLHLGLAAFERTVQLRRLLRSGVLVYTHRHTPVIVAGDFNDVYGTLGKRMLRRAGFEPAVRRVKTFPAALPLRPLDRVYFRGDLTLVRSFASRTVVARQASDHLPIIAEFEVP